LRYDISSLILPVSTDAYFLTTKKNAMMYFIKFLHSAGGEGGTGNPAPEKDEAKKAADKKQTINPTPDQVEEDKTVGQKIKEALQDWSDKDEEDQEFDDTRV
jgi:hypothetical protein